MAKPWKKLNHSIQTRIMLGFSLLTVGITLCGMLMSYRYTTVELEASAVEYTDGLITQVNRDINRYVGYMEDVAEVVSKNGAVLDWMRSGDSIGDNEMLVLEDSVARELTNILHIRSDITNIGIFTQNGRAAFDTRGKTLNPYMDFLATDWYTEALARDGDTYVSTSHVQNVVQGEYKWVVSISKAVKSAGGNVMGVLLVDLNYSLINDLCDGIDMGDRGYLFVVDREGNMVFHPQQPLIYAGIKSEDTQSLVGRNGQHTVNDGSGERLYLSSHSEVTGWTVFGVAFTDELLRNQAGIVQFYTAIICVFILISLLLSLLLARGISGPLKRLTTSMKQVEQGDLDRRITITGPREVEQLGDSFNTMLSQLQQLIRQRESDQAQKRESEIKALQAQINPHFLYNTLDSIIWMAESERHEEVVEMTAALARLFRSSISEPRELVPLSVELANVISYLTIQKMRYREKLRFTVDVSPEVEGFQLPKLLLQPLVENAIYHGVKPREGGGEVGLRAWREGGCMLVEVWDDGVGMDEAQLQNVLSAQPGPAGSGIGVKNVHERIRLIYGEEYGLTFTSEAGRGTVVRVTLPAGEEEVPLW